MTCALHAKTFPVLTANLRSAVERLSTMRRSPEVLALKDAVQALEDELAAWPILPSLGQHQGMVSRILAIHFAIAKLAPRGPRGRRGSR
jgi:hypothetical protein